VEELQLTACPLLRPDDGTLVTAYNQIFKLAQRLDRDYPGLRTRRLDPEFKRLERIRDRLTREHYRIGFLGTTQAGKSTTFNNVLQVIPEESPARPGSSEATTSSVTRLRRLDQPPHTLALTYLTPQEYRDKRQLICDAVEINHTWEDEEVLRELEVKRAAISSGQVEGLIHDVKALGHFLLSYKRFHTSYIKNPPRRDQAPYGDREIYLNHPTVQGQEVQPSPTLLLKEATIGFATQTIPPSLEMIDLPGLGSQGVIDSLLTMDFLKQLDAALIFLRAEQIGDANVEKILAKMKPILEGRWHGRIWIVITRFDGLTEHHFAREQTTFDSIDRFLKRHDLLPENVCLTSNEVYTWVKKEGEGGAAAVLRRPLDYPVYARYPHYKKALDQLYHDGGISWLRNLIAGRLADAVAEEIRAAVNQGLGSVERTLQRAESDEQRRLRQSDADFDRIHQCRERLLDLLLELRGLPDYLTTPSQTFFEELSQVFKERTFKEEHLNEMALPRLQEYFETVTGLLDSAVSNRLEPELLDPVYEAVGSRLEDLPAVEIAGSPSVLEAWQRYHDQDRDNGGWKANLPGFKSDRLFRQFAERDVDARGFSGRAFRFVIAEKIRLVANQTMLVVRNRVRSRLQSLERDLAALTRDEGRGPRWGG
jgi:hypothetical protein